MTNQEVKALPFTLNGIPSFNVVATGNAETDFDIGSLLALVYLKSLRANYDDSKQVPLNAPQLLNLVLPLASVAAYAEILGGFLSVIDIFLQPMSHAARNGLDAIDLNKILADIANPNLDGEIPSTFKNLTADLGE